MSDKTKRAARIVHERTGMPYHTCRQLVLGERSLVPQAPDCLVQSSLIHVHSQPWSHWIEPVAKTPASSGPCACPRCDP